MSQSFLNSGKLVILCTQVLLLCVVVCKRGGEVSLNLCCMRMYGIQGVAGEPRTPLKYIQFPWLNGRVSISCYRGCMFNPRQICRSYWKLIRAIFFISSTIIDFLKVWWPYATLFYFYFPYTIHYRTWYSRFTSHSLIWWGGRLWVELLVSESHHIHRCDEAEAGWVLAWNWWSEGYSQLRKFLPFSGE
jgi:hypothetical protein